METMTSLKVSSRSYIDLAEITRATVKWAKKWTCGDISTGLVTEVLK